MSEYDYGVIGGSLKLKKTKDKFKKTKKSKKSKKLKKESIVESIADDTPAETTVHLEDSRTEYEKKIDQIRLQRRMERINKFAEKSHKDRVKEFNERLEREPEHHDMPKVGPG